MLLKILSAGCITAGALQENKNVGIALSLTGLALAAADLCRNQQYTYEFVEAREPKPINEPFGEPEPDARTTSPVIEDAIFKTDSENAVDSKPADSSTSGAATASAAETHSDGSPQDGRILSVAQVREFAEANNELIDRFNMGSRDKHGEFGWYQGPGANDSVHILTYDDRETPSNFSYNHTIDSVVFGGFPVHDPDDTFSGGNTFIFEAPQKFRNNGPRAKNIMIMQTYSAAGVSYMQVFEKLVEHLDSVSTRGSVAATFVDMKGLKSIIDRQLKHEGFE